MKKWLYSFFALALIFIMTMEKEISVSASEMTESIITFDENDYAQRYPDVSSSLGNDKVKLWNHYQSFGKTEGRIAHFGAETTNIVSETIILTPEENAADGFYDNADWKAYGAEYMINNDYISRMPTIVVDNPTDLYAVMASEKISKLVNVTNEMYRDGTWEEISVWVDAINGNDNELTEFIEYFNRYDWKTKDGKIISDHNARVYAMVKYFDNRVNDNYADYSIKGWCSRFENQNQIASNWTSFVPSVKTIGADTPYGYGLLAYAPYLKRAYTINVGKSYQTNVQFGNYISSYVVELAFEGISFHNIKLGAYFDSNNRLLNIILLPDSEDVEYCGLNFVHNRLTYQAEKCPQYRAPRLYYGIS